MFIWSKSLSSKQKFLALIIISILLASVKFAMTFPLAVLQFKFSFFETILYLNIGGALGVIFFAYLSEYINRWWIRFLRNRRKKRNKTLQAASPLATASEQKKIFTRRNRRIITIKQRYGLAGIAMATPILFSIPIGVFLVVHYYHDRRHKLLWLLGANLGWSFIYTAFYTFFYELVR